MRYNDSIARYFLLLAISFQFCSAAPVDNSAQTVVQNYAKKVL